jgi:zinc carboxypeptidase
MLTRARFLAAIIGMTLASPAWAQAPPTPEAYFKFQPGAEGQLLDYEQLLGYLQELDQASPRLELRRIGTSPQGKPMMVAFISSEANLARLDELGKIGRRLALDPAIPDAERAALVERGRVFLLATLSMHSDEMAPTQSFPLYAYELAVSRDPATLHQLEEVVWMIVPSQNPDGLDMVVENYRKYRGTPWDGSSLPRVYHRYVGHDNNRDYVTLSQEDTRAIARLYSTEWFPQVMVEKHGMGSAGPRYYCPPNHDPIAENVDAEVWSWINVFGTNMARDMAHDGLKGVSQHWEFDNYWPGSTETALWKNSIALLTENATPNGASPVYLEPNELEGGGKGLSEYKKSVNMPDPWPGGWWRLSDAVHYELSSFRSLLRTAAENRADLLRFQNDLCRREVARGRSQPPYYFVLPPSQRDRGEWVNLVNLLADHGVQLFRLPQEVASGSRRFEAGSVVVPLAQPFRPFIQEVMEKQRYPIRHYTPDGEMIRPYDITSWSLPLHRGVTAEAVETRMPEMEAAWQSLHAPFALGDRVSRLPPGTWGIAFRPDENEAFRAAFLALAAGRSVGRTTTPANAGGTRLPAGAIIIRGGTGTPTEALLEKVAVPPVVLTAAPEGTLASLKLPRVALVETYFHDMEAGWTRFLFDSYGVPFKVVHPGEIEKLDLAASYDLIVFPSNSKEELMEGHFKQDEKVSIPDLPPEFRKGIGSKGMQKLIAFVDQGGIILAWGEACDVFLGVQEIKRGKEKDAEGEEFQLPVENVAKELGKKGFAVPGSWMHARFTQDSPLTWGMPEDGGYFFQGKPVFRTSVPGPDMDRRVLVSHPETDILLSGFAENEKLLANTVAGVWARKGRGQFVLYSFSPNFRGSTPSTSKLIFNAVLLPRIVQRPSTP